MKQRFNYARIQGQTNKFVKEGFYVNTHGVKVFLNQSAEAMVTKYECTETNPITFLCYEGTHKTKFSVVSSDLIDYAVDVRKEATTAPLVFLEINPSKPGGNWRWGSDNFEEKLCRRTTLLFALNRAYEAKNYPLEVGDALLIPELGVFRGQDKDNNVLYDHPKHTPAAAVTLGKSLKKATKGIHPASRQAVACAFYNFCLTARSAGYTHLLIPPIACGASTRYGLSPHHVAITIFEVVDLHFFGCFESITVVVPEEDTAVYRSFKAIVNAYEDLVERGERAHPLFGLSKHFDHIPVADTTSISVGGGEEEKGEEYQGYLPPSYKHSSDQPAPSGIADAIVFPSPARDPESRRNSSINSEAAQRAKHSIRAASAPRGSSKR